MAKAPKIYPDPTFEKTAHALGLRVNCLWQTRGPEDTSIAWMECFLIEQRGVVIVQTFENGGWDVFTPLNTGRADLSIADALNRSRDVGRPEFTLEEIKEKIGIAL